VRKVFSGVLGTILVLAGFHGWQGCKRADIQTIDVQTLLAEMTDFENLSRLPDPFFKQAASTSYSRESHKGGKDWFHNLDRGEYIRTETKSGRREHVLLDEQGSGTVSRFWTANPKIANMTRFYFDGEETPRLAVPFYELFTGKTVLFGPEFSYISGTGGNLYFPLPYADSLKITIQEEEKPLALYYEIGYRTYPQGTSVRSFHPAEAQTWAETKSKIARALISPEAALFPKGSERIGITADIEPGETFALPVISGKKAVFEWSVQVSGLRESLDWEDPYRAHNAYRFLILEAGFDGEESIEVPLGDFFGSAPGVNPYENLFFSVEEKGRMTSRLLMPFRKSMELRLYNAGNVPYNVEMNLHVGPFSFGKRGCHLRVQWGTLTRDTWPRFDVNFLSTEGKGKVVGSVYMIANDGLIWWGEGDQKISVDGESFPSTFGTGTEDDYGYAYGYNRPFVRPYHAQTRVDGPGSGGHISLNRWYVLDAFPYRSSLRFDQEMWHWMPCRPTWTYVVYWYARPGTPGPQAIDRGALAAVDLGIRENKLDPLEGELLDFKISAGSAGKERLANCSRAEHLVWRDSKPGDRLEVHFPVPDAGQYSVELNLCQSPHYGRYRLYVNGVPVGQEIDGYSEKLFWIHPKLGVFDLKEGDNILEVRTLEPNPAAETGNLFGLDYIFLIRKSNT
jgi:hypothetical protein